MSREAALPPVASSAKVCGVIVLLKLAGTLACFWYLFRYIDVAELRQHALPGLEVRWVVLAVSGF